MDGTARTLAVAVLCASAGCLYPPIGSHSPVTHERLAGARLSAIDDSVEWRFDETHVVVESRDRRIPADVANLLVAGERPIRRIECRWTLDEESGVLHLSHVMADGERRDDVAVPIEPQGLLRVDVGPVQYQIDRIANRRNDRPDP